MKGGFEDGEGATGKRDLKMKDRDKAQVRRTSTLVAVGQERDAAHFLGMCGAGMGLEKMGWDSCWYPHSLFIVLVSYNNPSDLLRRSKRRVRLMSQMMADNCAP